MTYRMLEAQNSHEQKYLQDVFMLAMLHDIGAYKTEKIDRCLFLRQKYMATCYLWLFVHKELFTIDKLTCYSLSSS
ncbi:MAG: hypothetical protein ACLRQF_09655 [Thomasclavelia ramosa]